MTEQEFIELAAAAALNALDADEREAFDRALAEHPEWESIADAEREAAALLAGAVSEETPRPEVRQALFDQLDALIGAGMTPSAMRVSDQAVPASEKHAAVDPSDVNERASESSETHPDALAPQPAQPLPPTQAPRPSFNGLPPELSETVIDLDDSEERPRPRRRFGVRLVAALAITALLAGVGAGLFGVMQPAIPDNVQVAERITQAPDVQFASSSVESGGQAGVTWSLSEGRALFVAQGIEQAPSGHTYELWLVRGEEKIPAGTFDPDTAGEALVLVNGEMHEGDTVAVTVEVTGGAADGKPSDMLVVSIPTSAAENSA